MFNDILDIINSQIENFDEACLILKDCIDTEDDFIETLRQIEIIPESIAHDSTEEKLFSKASDIVLSRAFREIGLKSSVFSERADSADILVESKIFGYTLVSDAKAFRLSRTAKNQKDFKISALSSWRRDNNYAVLCAPYFQYPARNSQIYAQALSHNVCLLSWEHLIFMIEQGIKENVNLNLSEIWNFSDKFSHHVLVSDIKKNFVHDFNKFIMSFLNTDEKIFNAALNKQTDAIVRRSSIEKMFLLEKIEHIKNYSREQAINELIKSQKIHEKLKHIDAYITGITQ